MAEAQQIEIRRITEADNEAFYVLRLEALEGEPQAFSSSPEEHRALTLEEVSRRLGSDADDRNFVLGAFVDERPVAMAGFFQNQGPKTKHRGFIWGVYVSPQWRRKGVARVLLEEIIRRVKSRPEVEQITLAVGTTQSGAKHLYESLGFQTYGRDPRAIKLGDTYIDEDMLILRIKQ
jgi:ribosomal protein S18 acetylase RimI-like enzyme